MLFHPTRARCTHSLYGGLQIDKAEPITKNTVVCIFKCLHSFSHTDAFKSTTRCDKKSEDYQCQHTVKDKQSLFCLVEVRCTQVQNKKVKKMQVITVCGLLFTLLFALKMENT